MKNSCWILILLSMECAHGASTARAGAYITKVGEYLELHKRGNCPSGFELECQSAQQSNTYVSTVGGVTPVVAARIREQTPQVKIVQQHARHWLAPPDTKQQVQSRKCIRPTATSFYASRQRQPQLSQVHNASLEAPALKSQDSFYDSGIECEVPLLLSPLTLKARQKDKRTQQKSQIYAKQEEKIVRQATIQAETMLLHKKLQSLGLKYRLIGSDGNCLFRALSDQLYGSPDFHLEVRREVCQFMRAYSDYFANFLVAENREYGDYATIQEHIARMSKPGEFGHQLEVTAFGLQRSLDIYIYRGDQVKLIREHEAERHPDSAVIHLGFTGGNHYTSIRRIDNDQVPPRNDRICYNSELPATHQEHMILRETGNVVKLSRVRQLLSTVGATPRTVIEELEKQRAIAQVAEKMKYQEQK